MSYSGYLLRFINVLKASESSTMSPLPFGAGFSFFDNMRQDDGLSWTLAAVVKQGAKYVENPVCVLAHGVFRWEKGGNSYDHQE